MENGSLTNENMFVKRPLYIFLKLDEGLKAFMKFYSSLRNQTSPAGEFSFDKTPSNLQHLQT